MKFNNTYDLLKYYCSTKDEVRVVFSQIHSSELTPTVEFCTSEIKDDLEISLSVWFSGGTSCLYDSVDFIFELDENELSWDLDNEVIEEFRDDYYEDYFIHLDIEDLRDDVFYEIVQTEG